MSTIIQSPSKGGPIKVRYFDFVADCPGNSDKESVLDRQKEKRSPQLRNAGVFRRAN